MWQVLLNLASQLSRNQEDGAMVLHHEGHKFGGEELVQVHLIPRTQNAVREHLHHLDRHGTGPWCVTRRTTSPMQAFVHNCTSVRVLMKSFSGGSSGFWQTRAMSRSKSWRRLLLGGGSRRQLTCSASVATSWSCSRPVEGKDTS